MNFNSWGNLIALLSVYKTRLVSPVVITFYLDQRYRLYPMSLSWSIMWKWITTPQKVKVCKDWYFSWSWGWGSWYCDIRLGMCHCGAVVYEILVHVLCKSIPKCLQKGTEKFNIVLPFEGICKFWWLWSGLNRFTWLILQCIDLFQAICKERSRVLAAW